MQCVQEWRRRDRDTRRPAGVKPLGADTPAKDPFEQYLSVICYKCYARGHTSPHCRLGHAPATPKRREQFEQIARSHFRALTPLEQETLVKSGLIQAFITDEVATTTAAKAAEPPTAEAQEK